MTENPAASPRIAVVVPTLGRTAELGRLLDSLQGQSHGAIEVVIVDQNDDDRLAAVVDPARYSFSLRRIRTPGARGSSRARNVGLRETTGEIVVFADDDCWYPQDLFARVAERMQPDGPAILGGMAADETGRAINGRYELTAQAVNRRNVWTTSIEWMLFFRRESIESIGGFDESIGIGASTPWQSAEGQDAVLRALAGGHTAFYDPSLKGRHAELPIAAADEAGLRKARAYARGMGFVLRKHGYGLIDMAKWLGRPSGAALLFGLRGETNRLRYYANVALGRMEGWRARA